MQRTGRGSLRGTLVLAPDWDSDAVNESIAAEPEVYVSAATIWEIAQARCEALCLVTRDRRCQRYDVAILPA